MMTDSEYKYIVVEDDLQVCEGIKRRMLHFPNWKCSGLFASYTDAVKNIFLEKPDLLFLDWSIRGGNTFDLLNEVRLMDGYDPYLIFFTGYQSDRDEIHEKMVNIYRVHRYFSKPIWEKMDLYLVECIKDAVQHRIKAKPNEDCIWLQTIDKQKIKVNPQEIVCINQSENPRNKILCFSNTILYEIKAKWESCEKILRLHNVNYFVVNQRECIINLDCIEKIGNDKLLLKYNIHIKISKEKLKELEMVL